ncbi:MAG TPA: L-threonylcarbamoyladenylate synthase [Anaeromyxobacteraceae bacterium]|nr:L-threonylcarbamoyladenylate synthase [Anaeromyxobacteraceae bacterium]
MLDRSLQARVEAAAGVLRRGGLVAYPTETFYGLGALASDAQAVSRVAAVKGRPDGKPLPLLAADLAAVEAVALLGPLARRLAGRLWPGALTLVVPARPGLPPEIVAGTGAVGIRIPGSELARALARSAGGPIVSTSANLSGEPPVSRAADLAPALRARLDAVLDAGSTPGGLPSTVVAVEEEAVRLLRAGVVPLEDVLRAARA